MLLKMFIKKLIITCGTSIIIAIVILHPILFEPGYPAFHDLSPIWSYHQLFRPFNYPWDPYSNLGYPQVLPSNAIYNLGLILFSIVFQGALDLAHKFYILFIVAFSCLGFAMALRYIKLNWIACILGGIAFTLSPFLQARFIHGHNTIILANALSTIPIVILFRSLKRNSIKEGFLAGALIGSLAYLNPHISYMLAIASLPIIIFTKLLDKNYKNKIKNFICIAIPHYLAILALWIPIAIRLEFEASSYNLVRVEESYSGLSIVQVIENHFLEIVLILIPLALAFKKIGYKRPIKEEFKERLLLGFLTLAFIGLILSCGGLKEFYSLYSMLFIHIPGFWIFRDSSKFQYFIALGIAYLSAYLTDRANQIFKDQKSKIVSILMIVCILLVFFIQWNIYVLDKVGCTTLNEDFKELFKELGSLDDNYRLLSIPPANWATRYSWQKIWFLDPIISLQEVPTIEVKGDEDISRSADFVRWVYTSIAGNYTNNLKGLMKLLSAKYILIRHDASLPCLRDDLKFLVKIKPSKEILSGFRKIWQKGDYEIYSLEDSPSILQKIDDFTLIYGDRRTLLTALSDEYQLDKYPPVFIEDLIEPIEVRRVLIDGRFLELARNSSNLKIISLTKYASASTIYSNRWVSGGLLWYLKDGIYSFAENGFIICKGESELSLTESINPGHYSIYLSYLTLDKSKDCLLEVWIMDKRYIINCNSTYVYKIAYLGDSIIDDRKLNVKIIKKGDCELALSNLYLVKFDADIINANEVVVYFEDSDLTGEKIEQMHSPNLSNGMATSYNRFEVNIPSFGSGVYEVYMKIFSKKDGLVYFRLNSLERNVIIKGPLEEVLKVSEVNLTRNDNLRIEFKTLSGTIFIDYIKIRYIKPENNVPKTYILYNVSNGKHWKLGNNRPIALALGYASIFKASSISFTPIYLGSIYTTISSLIGLISLVISFLIVIAFEPKIYERRSST